MELDISPLVNCIRDSELFIIKDESVSKWKVVRVFILVMLH